MQGTSIVSHLHSLGVLSQNPSDLQAIEMYSPQLWRLAVYVQESCVVRFPWALASRLQMAVFSWYSHAVEGMNECRWILEPFLYGHYGGLAWTPAWEAREREIHRPRWTGLALSCSSHLLQLAFCSAEVNSPLVPVPPSPWYPALMWLQSQQSRDPQTETSEVTSQNKFFLF